MGHTHIRLAEANEDVLRGALHAAWKLRTEMNAKTRATRRPSPGVGGAPPAKTGTPRKKRRKR